MPFKFDFLNDRVLEWSVTADGDVVVSERTDYTPRFYIAPRSPETDPDLDGIRSVYAAHPDVVATEYVQRRPGFRRDRERVLAVDVSHVDRIASLAQQARQLTTAPVGDLACFNVDFSREFRYSLENELDPTPADFLSTLRLGIPTSDYGADSYSELHVEGDVVTGSPTELLEAVRLALTEHDPDVLVVDRSELVPTLYAMAEECGIDDFDLGRRPGYQQLATHSTYTSYGRVGHSPARYNVPGRAIIDRSNTFFYGETNLDGCLDLVSRSWKPIQELAWASIGNVLTAIQIREAHSRDVLTPWNSWRHEFYKPMTTLHDADRGGFIFTPDVGVHDDVHELDFSSLYPNIICTRNVSPDVIRCDCHADRDDVPGLGYAICDKRGYLADVLQPLIDDRDDIKEQLRQERRRENSDQARIDALEGRSAAIKWILVACFGYQGFSNAKFGRIECHEAINAYAREILLTAKQALEDAGWRVVHGIVDSIWVTPDPEVPSQDRQPLDAVAADITDAVGIRLEYEATYEWVAFVPQRNSDAGALTKYFGQRADTGEYKLRGIEARQRSTPPFIEAVQRDCIELIGETRSPEAVCDRIARAITRLYDGDVDPQSLITTNTVSKPLADYQHSTRNVAALQRAADHDHPIHPGQDVEYIVVDDETSSRERVALAHEHPDRYDPAYYETELLRATESILSPFGWDQSDITRFLAESHDTDLRTYT